MRSPARIFTFLVCVLALTASSIATQPPMGIEAGRVRIETAFERPNLTPGDQIGFAIILHLEHGWHINPGLETGQASAFQIPSEITLDLPEGWAAGETQWPDPLELDLPALGGVVPVYEDEVVVFVPLTLPANVTPGPHAIGITLSYQACDDSVCEMPASLDALAEANVVSGAVDPPTESPTDVAALFQDFTRDFPPPLAAPNKPQRVSVELVWERPQLVPNDQVGLAIIMNIQEHWHIQPGEGSPELQSEQQFATEIKLNLPAGWKAGDIQWPPATTIMFGPEGMEEEIPVYDGRVTAFVSITLPTDATIGEVPIIADVIYQACDDGDICEEPARFSTSRKTHLVDPATTPVDAPDQNAVALFAQYQPSFEAASVEAEASQKESLFNRHTHWWVTLLFVLIGMGWMITRSFQITRRSGWRASMTILGLLVIFGWYGVVKSFTAESEINWVSYTTAEFDRVRAEDEKIIVVEFTADWCLNCKVQERTTLARPEVVNALNAPNVVAFQVDFSGPNPEGEAKKAELGGGGIPLTAIYLPGVADPVALRGNYVSSALLDAMGGKLQASSNGNTVFDFLGWQFNVGQNAWPLVFFISLVAGFLMNLTPCVMPVIPIKILSLQAHAKNPVKCFELGLLFGLGMITFFLVLGALVLGVLAGFRLDWGEMFTLWWVNGGVGILVIVMGIGMLGVFTMQLPNAVYMLNPQGDSLTGSFLMGAFAAVLSTPCTGPMVGASIAWVASQPIAIGFLTFLGLGVGMAFPYVLLTAKPSWLDRIPKAGPGSELVKQVMGILLFAVAAFFIGNAVLAF